MSTPRGRGVSWDRVNSWTGVDPGEPGQYVAIADPRPAGIDFDLIVEQLAKLTAAYQPPAPVVTCQNCGQPTLYDRACRYCGGAP